MASQQSNGTGSKSEAHKVLTGHFIESSVADCFAELIDAGKIKLEEIDERAVEAVKSLKPDQALVVLKQFKEGNLLHVPNKASYLCALIKSFKDKFKQMGPAAASDPLIKGPNEERLKAILDRTHYPLEVTIGQRKYGGPPPNWDSSKGHPGAGCEVYVGKVPNSVYEDELIPIFEQCGTLWDLRLMMDPLTSQNKGYCFVTYCTKEAAKLAAKRYDGHEIKPGKRLKVNVSIANQRLFIGNIPKSKSKDEIMEEFSKVTEGLNDVIVYHAPDDLQRKRNRGFCFLHYEDHKCASNAKRKLSSGRFHPFNCDLVVDWAEQQEEPDDDVMQTVKVLYVKNLKATVTEDALRLEFSKYGEIERVRKVKDYAFVHFSDRDDALKAMDALHGHDFDGLKCTITLAKPQMDKKKREMMIMEREKRQLPQMRHTEGVVRGPAAHGFEYAPPPAAVGMVRGRGGSRMAAVPRSLYGAYDVDPGYYDSADYHAATEEYDEWNYGSSEDYDGYYHDAGASTYGAYPAAPVRAPAYPPAPLRRTAYGPPSYPAGRGRIMRAPSGGPRGSVGMPARRGGGGMPVRGGGAGRSRPSRGRSGMAPGMGGRGVRGGLQKRKNEADFDALAKRRNAEQGWDVPIAQQPMEYSHNYFASDDLY